MNHKLETLTLDNLSDYIHLDETPVRLINAHDLPDTVSLAELFHPLVQCVEHSLKLPFRYREKECGTTVPLALYLSMKAHLMHTMSIDVESTEGTVRTLLRDQIRQYMRDVNRAHNRMNSDSELRFGKVICAGIFDHVIYNKPIILTNNEDQFLSKFERSKAAKAHTVGGKGATINVPTFTTPEYLCSWFLHKEKLNPETDFIVVNPVLKQVAKLVYSQLKLFGPSVLSGSQGFSRRVQNVIFLLALASVDPDMVFNIKILNPVKYPKNI